MADFFNGLTSNSCWTEMMTSEFHSSKKENWIIDKKCRSGCNASSSWSLSILRSMRWTFCQIYVTSAFNIRRVISTAEKHQEISRLPMKRYQQDHKAR